VGATRGDSSHFADYRRNGDRTACFTEGNHVCAVWRGQRPLAELQDRAVEVGHGQFPPALPLSLNRAVDLSHQAFGLDHNRCILCNPAACRVWRRGGGRPDVWTWPGGESTAGSIAGLDQPWGAVGTACTGLRLVRDGLALSGRPSSTKGATRWRRKHGSASQLVGPAARPVRRAKGRRL